MFHRSSKPKLIRIRRPPERRNTCDMDRVPSVMPRAKLIPSSRSLAANWRRGSCPQTRRTPDRRANILVTVEVVLNLLRVLGLRQRQLEQHARLGRIELHRRHRPELVVVELDVAPDDAAVGPR